MGRQPLGVSTRRIPQLSLRTEVLYLSRHAYGTKICREKGIEYARRLLGHSNISTTRRYIHLDDQELADAQDLID